MTRTEALRVSIILTVGLLALVVGIGATTGQFGFSQGGTTVDAQAVTPTGTTVDAPAATTGDGIVSQQAPVAGSNEHANDGGEHAGDTHEADEHTEREDDD
jgi:hypothetical protein